MLRVYKRFYYAGNVIRTIISFFSYFKLKNDIVSDVKKDLRETVIDLKKDLASFILKMVSDMKSELREIGSDLKKGVKENVEQALPVHDELQKVEPVDS